MKLLAPVACAAALLMATPAEAQLPRPERPYRGLFGGGVGETEQSLILTVSLGGGYDDNVFVDQGAGFNAAPPTVPPQDPRLSQSGTYGAGSAALNYSLTRTRVSLRATLGSTSRYYNDGDLINGFIGAHNGSIGATFKPGERTSLSLTQTALYQPFLTLNVFPQVFELPVGQVEAPTLDFDASREGLEFDAARQDHMTYESIADFSAGLGRRGTFSLGYRRTSYDFGNDEQQPGLVTHGGAARYAHGLAKGLSARIGYGYTEGRYPSSEEVAGDNVFRGHIIDAGLDFNRALSFSRRTMFSFTTGSTGVSDRERTYYRFTGNANLNHEIGRSWNAGIGYARALEFVQTFRQPLFSDSLNVFFGGMINRRLQFHSGAGVAIGSIGVTADANRFDTYFGNVGTTFGLSRYLGLSVDYFYYRYQFDRATSLPEGVSRELDRNGIRASVTLWAPLVHRARRPDAAR